METIWLAVLGFIQGFTEFLPISSSGHLALAQIYLANHSAGPPPSSSPLLVEVFLHVATMLAITAFFRRDVAEALLGAGRGVRALLRGHFTAQLAADKGQNLAFAVLVGTIPTGIIGLGIEDRAEAISRNPQALGFCFLACAALLLATRWWKGGEKRLTMRVALIIGIVQGIAVLPGISRSGTTIAAALALGLDREEAARFSFLLSIPAVFGATLLKADASELAASGFGPSWLAAASIAFVAGLASLFVLVRIVRAGRLWLFAPYVGAVGLVSIFFL